MRTCDHAWLRTTTHREGTAYKLSYETMAIRFVRSGGKIGASFRCGNFVERKKPYNTKPFIPIKLNHLCKRFTIEFHSWKIENKYQLYCTRFYAQLPALMLWQCFRVHNFAGRFVSEMVQSRWIVSYCTIVGCRRMCEMWMHVAKICRIILYRIGHWTRSRTVGIPPNPFIQKNSAHHRFTLELKLWKLCRNDVMKLDKSFVVCRIDKSP